MQEWIITICGWLGMILILLAYLLISLEKVDAKSKLYQSLNMVGSCFFIYHLFSKSAWPAMWLNVIWASIALLVLIKIFRDKKKS